MKKLLFLLLPLVVLLATGCPVGLNYSLGTPGKDKIDNDLIGTWVCESEGAEVVKVTLKKGEDHSYAVNVVERGEMYSLETDVLTGWVTNLDDKKFAYFKPDGSDQFYHYCYWLDGSTLMTTDVSLLDGGVDAVNSTQTMREQVSRSIKMDGWGDEIHTWNKQE
jgi:hypothetical protein